jgi:dihydrodipicolinate synthase/N-acetylneuraminate lyase
MAEFTHEDIYGTVVPFSTILDEHENLDEEATAQLARHIAGPDPENPFVEVAFLGGMTGGLPWTDRKAKKAALEVTRQAIGGAIPILFCAASGNLDSTKKLVEYGCGRADGIIAVPFYMGYDSENMPDAMREIAEMFPGPVYAYINAYFGRKTLNPDDFARMLDIDNFWGIKYSRVEPETLAAYREKAREKPGARVFTGDEDKLLMAGERPDWVPSFANIDPELCGSVRDSSKDRLHLIQDYINQADRIVYCNRSKSRNGIVETLHCMGIGGGYQLEPGEPLTRDEKGLIRDFVATNYPDKTVG